MVNGQFWANKDNIARLSQTDLAGVTNERLHKGRQKKNGTDIFREPICRCRVKRSCTILNQWVSSQLQESRTDNKGNFTSGNGGEIALIDASPSIQISALNERVATEAAKAHGQFHNPILIFHRFALPPNGKRVFPSCFVSHLPISRRVS